MSSGAGPRSRLTRSPPQFSIQDAVRAGQWSFAKVSLSGGGLDLIATSRCPMCHGRLRSYLVGDGRWRTAEQPIVDMYGNITYEERDDQNGPKPTGPVSDFEQYLLLSTYYNVSSSIATRVVWNTNLK